MDSLSVVAGTVARMTTLADQTGPYELTEQDRGILDVERQWWKYAGAKEQELRDRFDLSATRYYQRLNALIDTQAALAHDPLLVRRLRRLRDQRQRARAARRQVDGA